MGPMCREQREREGEKWDRGNPGDNMSVRLVLIRGS